MTQTDNVEKHYTKNLDVAIVGQVIRLGHSSYLVLDTYDSKGGRCVWLVVKRLRSKWREAGQPFRLMVVKQNRE